MKKDSLIVNKNRYLHGISTARQHYLGKIGRRRITERGDLVQIRNFSLVSRLWSSHVHLTLFRQQQEQTPVRRKLRDSPQRGLRALATLATRDDLFSFFLFFSSMRRTEKLDSPNYKPSDLTIHCSDERPNGQRRVTFGGRARKRTIQVTVGALIHSLEASLPPFFGIFSIACDSESFSHRREFSFPLLLFCRSITTFLRPVIFWMHFFIPNLYKNIDLPRKIVSHHESIEAAYCDLALDCACFRIGSWNRKQRKFRPVCL